MRLSDQDVVVDLMDRERYIVSCKLRLLTRDFDLGLGHIIGLLNLQQRGQGLGELGSTGRKVLAALVDDRVYRWDRRSPGDAETTGLDLNQLRIRHMHEAAVIPYRWKIRTLCDLLRMSLLLNRVAGNTDIVIVRKRHLN